MKAVVTIEQGTPDVMKLVDLPMPTAGAGQVLVKVAASGVNPIDTKVRRIKLPMTPTHFPAILQTDFSGTVTAVGSGVQGFAVGDAVYGFAGGFHGPQGDVPGALAEYLVADAELIAHKPANLDFREAAALPLVAATAWLALYDKVTLTPNSKVLIQGGTGGVGHIAVQLAKAAGAQVFATVRGAESAVQAKALGADVVIDLATTTPQAVVAHHTDGQGFDVIFDTVGGALLDAAFQMIRPAGDVITVVGAASHNLAPLYLRGANLHTVLVLIPIIYGHGRKRQGEILEAVRQLTEAGKLRPVLDPKRFRLETAADAHRALEAGQMKGKLVVDIALE